MIFLTCHTEIIIPVVVLACGGKVEYLAMMLILMVVIIKMTTHTDIDDMVMIMVMIIPTDTDGNTTTKVNLIKSGCPSINILIITRMI